MPRIRSTKSVRRKRKPKSDTTPSIKLHRHSGQGYIRLNGQVVYLGRYGSPECEERHRQVIADWQASGKSLPVESRELTIVELSDRFMEHAEVYYAASNQGSNFKRVLDIMVALYGKTLVREFGPRRLKACREQMIHRGWCRTEINRCVGLVRQVVRWAVAEELCEASVLQRLESVAPLKRGRCEAKERDPVKPIREDVLQKVIDAAVPTLAAMLKVQWYSGCRPGEVCVLRPVDLDTSRDTYWVFRPEVHKLSYRGTSREILLGPRAIEAIKPFLNRPVDSYCFSPREAEEQRYAACETHRRPNQRPNPSRTGRTLSDRYDSDAYGRAVRYACQRPGVEPFGPNRIRHTVASRLAAEHGVADAACILGHSLGSRITEVYIE